MNTAATNRVSLLAVLPFVAGFVLFATTAAAQSFLRVAVHGGATVASESEDDPKPNLWLLEVHHFWGHDSGNSSYMRYGSRWNSPSPATYPMTPAGTMVAVGGSVSAATTDTWPNPDLSDPVALAKGQTTEEDSEVNVGTVWTLAPNLVYHQILRDWAGIELFAAPGIFFLTGSDPSAERPYGLSSDSGFSLSLGATFDILFGGRFSLRFQGRYTRYSAGELEFVSFEAPEVDDVGGVDTFSILTGLGVRL